MSSALSAMKLMLYDVTDIQHPGAQRYICKHCSKTFQLNFSYSGAKPDTHQTIVNMAMNGYGCRDTARVLGISLNTVLRHLKKFRQSR
ncbi:IS1-like element transposase [Erwinia tracheiphila]|uniref:IS1-like element transposase n=1 Tax=Erwinia tracheiphila TaxID=65700 RepID=UPI0030035BC3